MIDGGNKEKMNDEFVRNVIIGILNNSGIITDLETQKTDDVNLIEYNINSLALVGLFVDIENELNICIPDEYLQIETLQSLNGFIDLITQLTIESTQSKDKDIGIHNDTDITDN